MHRSVGMKMIVLCCVFVSLSAIINCAAAPNQRTLQPFVGPRSPATPAPTPVPAPSPAIGHISRVAVLELRNDAQIEARDIDYLTEVVRTGARKALPINRFILMTKENIQDLLPPDRKNLANCEGQCEVETGRIIGAEFLVTGSVTRFADQLRVTIRLYNVAEGNLLDSRTGKAKSLLELEAPIENISITLFSAISEH